MKDEQKVHPSESALFRDNFNPPGLSSLYGAFSLMLFLFWGIVADLISCLRGLLSRYTNEDEQSSSLQMCNVFVTFTLGYMMMAVTGKKDNNVLVNIWRQRGLSALCY